MTLVTRLLDDGLDDAWRAPAASEVPAEFVIQSGQRLSRYTSFRVGGVSEYLARPRDLAELRAAVAWARQAGVQVRAIGGGSNLIVSDRGVPGLLIVYRAEGEHITFEEQGEQIIVDAPTQIGLSRLGRFCCERGWRGLDWAVGLPGTVGGAIANNAGAHGAEMIDRLVNVTVMNGDGRIQTHPASWLEARYRYTVLRAERRDRSETAIAVHARLQLERGDADALLTLATGNANWRKQHQPRNPCAGSIFKNPPGGFAGALIESAGLKGRQIGGARVSPVHANFIVNAGGATSADVAALIAEIRAVVWERFEVRLETEVEFVGEWERASLSPQLENRVEREHTT